jgi:multidrug transporter EmrE-like cation transporter
MIFFTALLISLFLLHSRRGNIRIADLIVGFLVGTFNLLSNYFMILALSELKASVVFPVSSAGAIIAMTLGGRLLFEEYIDRIKIIAIRMTVVALVLINV